MQRSQCSRLRGKENSGFQIDPHSPARIEADPIGSEVLGWAKFCATSAVNPSVNAVAPVNRAPGAADKSSRCPDQLRPATTSANNELRGFQFARATSPLPYEPEDRSIGKFGSRLALASSLPFVNVRARGISDSIRRRHARERLENRVAGADVRFS